MNEDCFSETAEAPKRIIDQVMKTKTVVTRVLTRKTADLGTGRFLAAPSQVTDCAEVYIGDGGLGDYVLVSADQARELAEVFTGVAEVLEARA